MSLDVPGGAGKDCWRERWQPCPLQPLDPSTPLNSSFPTGLPSTYAIAAERTLSAFATRLGSTPLALPALCCAAHTFSEGPLRQASSHTT